MADELLMEIVTPEKMIFSGNIEEVTLPGTEGEFGVLRGHEAFFNVRGNRRDELCQGRQKVVLCGEYRLCGSYRR